MAEADLQRAPQEIRAEAVRLAGWDHVSNAIRYQGVLPASFFADPLGYADTLRAASPA
jgi:hypothetical protein